MKPIKININASVFVRLTPKGMNCALRHWQKSHGLEAAKACSTVYGAQWSTGGVIKMQIYEIMQLFGPETFMGGGGPHIVNNSFELTDYEWVEK